MTEEKKKQEILGMDVRKLFRVGGSLAFTIPKEYANAHELKEGSPMKIYFDEILHTEPLTEEEILKKLGKKKVVMIKK